MEWLKLLQLFLFGSLLCFSLIGHLFWLSKHIHGELALGVLFAGIGSVMFIAGILHFLLEAAWIIFGAGLWFAYRSLKRKERVRQLLTPGVLFFACAAVFFLFLLYGIEFTHYDNFSHWGIAVKVICEKNNLPNIADTTILFQSYPLGSACFIYYICEIVGRSDEWLQAWAQAILMLGMASSLFVFAKRKEHYILTAVCILMLLCSNISFVDLLVDTLLPLTALSAFCFCIYYKKDISSKIICVISYTVFLVGIKNSGALFAIFIFLYALFCENGNAIAQKKWVKAALVPAATLFLWQKHVTQAFERGAVSKHAMTLENVAKGLYHKSFDTLFQTSHAFLKEVFSFHNPAIYLISAGVLLLLFIKKMNSENAKDAREILILAGISYAVYQIGTLAMFFTTMPTSEASRLAGYTRYHSTILIFVSGLLLIGIMQVMDDLKGSTIKRTSSIALAAAYIFVMNISLSPHFDYYHKQNLEGTERVHFDSLIEEYAIDSGKRYLVLKSDTRPDDYGYLHYMTRYLLSSSDVTVSRVSSIDEAWRTQYDYVIVFEKAEETKAFMLENFGNGDLGTACLN